MNNEENICMTIIAGAATTIGFVCGVTVALGAILINTIVKLTNM